MQKVGLPMSVNTSVATTIPQISQDDYREISSFADAIELAKNVFGGVATADQLLSDGFAQCEKEFLINKPFFVISYKINDSKDHFDENGEAQKFAIVRIILENDEKYFFTDGSTGILSQLQTLAARGIHGGVMARKGLRVSAYEYTNESGNKSIAKTFYVNSDAK